MIDHITLPVRDFARSRAFYDAVLKQLGILRLSDFTDGDLTAAGYGQEAPITPFFLVSKEQAVAPMGGHHVAFVAPDRAAVDAFHRAALAAGATDNGAPGLRPYHPEYYAAFVIDPDGHHIEAVCHAI